MSFTFLSFYISLIFFGKVDVQGGRGREQSEEGDRSGGTTNER